MNEALNATFPRFNTSFNGNPGGAFSNISEDNTLQNNLTKVTTELAQLTNISIDLIKASQESDQGNAELRQQNALLQQKLDEHLKRVEKWDTRFWGLIMVMVGALLSLSAGLIVVLVKK